MREARDEAKKEIADYKASKEEEYKKFEAKVRRLRHVLSAKPIYHYLGAKYALGFPGYHGSEAGNQREVISSRELISWTAQ